MGLPTWLKSRYETLWEAFGNRRFRPEEALRVVREKDLDISEEGIIVLLAELRKRGWVKVEADQQDARRKYYILEPPEVMISSLFPEEPPEKLTRAELEALLKKAADLIRTRVDYTFILILLFYKRISDKWKAEFDQAYHEALEDGLSKEEALLEAKNSMYHDFDIPEEFLWEELRKDPQRLPENFSRAMKAMAERNPELRDVFENIDFVQFTSNRENAEILRQLVELFSSHSLKEVSPDILGDAYEWILRYFAPQKAKEGEVYTPREVIELMIKILDPKPGQSIYDPACGSAGMLITAYKYVEELHGREKADRLFLYGQEVNNKTLALAKMNLFIHDIRNAKLAQGDTLLFPKFKKGQSLQTFDLVIANPPWNQDAYGEETLKKGEFWRERYRYGFTSRQSADWAWIQHMLASSKEEGKVAIVIDNGALFRGGREKKIRSAVLEDDLLEAVILLPEKLFYNTGAPGAIMIFNKAKPEERKKKVLFINASKEFRQHPEVRKLNQLSPENIEKIAEAYRRFSEEEGFSRPVPIEEIKENDYNLNVTLYVFPMEEQEEIDVAKEWEELQGLEQKYSELKNKIKDYLEELEYFKGG